MCHIAAEGWQMFAANSAIHAFIDSDLCMQQGRIYLSPFPPVLYLDPLCAQRLRSMSQEVRRVSVISCPVLHGSIACCLDVQGFPSIIQDLYHCLWCNHNKASWCRSSRMERIQRTRLFKVIADRCKRTRVCFCCGATNGPVK